MNERIRELAEQAGIELGGEGGDEAWQNLVIFEKKDLEKFAELVRADEREACAKLCETFYNHEAKDCAEAIRARGKQ